MTVIDRGKVSIVQFGFLYGSVPYYHLHYYVVGLFEMLDFFFPMYIKYSKYELG